ncbi:hypothetical protein [Thiomicrospira sp. ALE5]|nr:hypothetical protein [Thiomicrospira sp. ALE5]
MPTDHCVGLRASVAPVPEGSDDYGLAFGLGQLAALKQSPS